MNDLRSLSIGILLFMLGHVMWPQRFIGFASGIFIYAWGTYYYFNQPIDVKTAVSLGLALVLIGVQVFWK